MTRVVEFARPLDRVIIPLDGMTLDEAVDCIRAFTKLGVKWFKYGKALINAGNASLALEVARDAGVSAFWDNKDLDILNTMLEAALKAVEQGVDMFNVYAQAGVTKMRSVMEAVTAAVPNEEDRPIVAAVTVLTDMDDADCTAVYGADVATTVAKFARWAEEAGIDALICSPKDLPVLARKRVAQGLLKVTPGIRPLWASTDEQKRAKTLFWAILNGTDMPVIGRPITKPPQEVGTPADALERIQEEIEAGLRARELRDRICELYYRTRSVQFGEFELSAHRDNPDLELSPIYLHYPKEGEEGAELLQELYELVAELTELYVQYCVGTAIDKFAGVPSGALPLAQAYAERSALEEDLLVFGKQQLPGGVTEFTHPAGDYTEGDNLFVLEDHTSGGRNKLLIKAAAEELGLVVTDMLTVVDRQQGGAGQLLLNGVTLHSLMTLDQLLAYGLANGFIDEGQVEKVQDYIDRNQLWQEAKAA